jgi:glycosyltransferase involved in cell wall biosynthesis
LVPTITFIVPSSGRKTLDRTLRSITSQFCAGDEIIVVFTDYGDGGNIGTNSAQGRACGEWIAFMDDDDLFVPGAIARMRAWAVENPGRIGIFRRKSDAWRTQWFDAVLRPGNVARPLFFVPNVPGKLAEWGPNAHRSPARQAELDARGVEPWSDARYIQETARLQDAEIVFVDLVTSYAQPQPLWRRLRYRLRVGTRVRRIGRAGRNHRPDPADTVGE